MRKRRKQQRSVLLARKKRYLRKQMRIKTVLDGLGTGLTVKDIHRRSGLSEKNIRKIMFDNPNEITFVLLKKEDKKNGQNK